MHMCMCFEYIHNGVTGGCVSPNIGAEVKLWPSGRTVCALNCWAISQALVPNHLHSFLLSCLDVSFFSSVLFFFFEQTLNLQPMLAWKLLWQPRLTKAPSWLPGFLLLLLLLFCSLGILYLFSNQENTVLFCLKWYFPFHT